METVELNLVTDKPDVPALITVYLNQVETVADGKPFHQKDVTQISMQSGRTFFVNGNYHDIKSLLGRKQ